MTLLAFFAAVFVAIFSRSICRSIGATSSLPATILYTVGAALAVYLIADAAVPANNRPWGLWVTFLGGCAGVITVGQIVLGGLDKEDGEKRDQQHRREWIAEQDDFREGRARYLEKADKHCPCGSGKKFRDCHGIPN